MSIYPVRLAEWFTHEDHEFSTIQIVLLYSRCYACGKKVRYKAAVGHHSLPWGHGSVWCSWKCCRSGKKARLDKRRERSYNRRSIRTLSRHIAQVLK